MKMKVFFGLLSMLMITFSIHSQSLLPSSVQQFLNERQYSKQYRKMQAAEGDYSRYMPSRFEDGVEVIEAFIAFDDEDVINHLHNAGVIINSIFDGFVTARIPLDQLEAVSVMPGVKDVEIATRLSLCTDSTMHATGVDYLLEGVSHGLPANYDGSGVIVAVIDQGFDIQHRAFRSNDDPSKTRIVRLYNTQVTTGHRAKYNKNAVLPGSVFMFDEIYALTTDRSGNTHGTHTASIAAGSHVNGYGGMAPGADIVLCAIGVIEGSVSSVEVANCVRYVDAYADSVGQPCVMSLSVNTPNGQHDGQDYLSKAINQIMGPGRAFVIAAGNNNGTAPWTHHNASPASPLNLMFTCRNTLGGDSTYYYRGVATDIWMRTMNTNFYYKFHVLDKKSGNIVWESDALSSKTKIDSSVLEPYFTYYSSTDTVGYISTETSFVSHGRKYRLEVSLYNLLCREYSMKNGVRVARYALGVTVYPRRDTYCEIDAWTCNSNSRFGVYRNPVIDIDGTVHDSFYAAPSDSCCIGTYTVGDSTISVGAYSARNSYYSLTQNKVVTDRNYTIGDIASFSGYQAAGAGPTGEALPTVCAPGTCVVAAASRYSYLVNSPETVMKSDDGSYWGVMSGTSMAAPTVAGIIALWMQANPNLSVAEIKEIIAETSVHDRFTMGPKHDQFGPNGKINARAGMELLLKKMKKPLMGDVNDDGVVNITDVTDLIRCLLSHQYSGINVENTDINANGGVDISDLALLINQLLSH